MTSRKCKNSVDTLGNSRGNCVILEQKQKTTNFIQSAYLLILVF